VSEWERERSNGLGKQHAAGWITAFFLFSLRNLAIQGCFRPPSSKSQTSSIGELLLLDFIVIRFWCERTIIATILRLRDAIYRPTPVVEFSKA